MSQPQAAQLTNLPDLASVEEEKHSDEEMLPAEEIRNSINQTQERNNSSERHSIFQNNMSVSSNAPASQNRWSSFGGQGSLNGLGSSAGDDVYVRPEGLPNPIEQLSSHTLASGNSYQDMLAKMSLLGSGSANQPVNQNRISCNGLNFASMQQAQK